MKRSLNILLASLLSLMVVFLSVGTTFMHCMHHDTVKVGAVETVAKEVCCADKKTEGKQWKKHCMEYQQVKLSPTLSVQQVDFDMAPLFAGIQPGAWSLLPRPVIGSIQKTRYWNRNMPHSPPRTYLALLNTLII